MTQASIPTPTLNESDVVESSKMQAFLRSGLWELSRSADEAVAHWRDGFHSLADLSEEEIRAFFTACEDEHQASLERMRAAMPSIDELLSSPTP